jgi:hypothetical protein
MAPSHYAWPCLRNSIRGFITSCNDLDEGINLMLVTFPAYGRSASCTFKCLACKKDKRKRTFRVEMTVNPYNTHADGNMKQAFEVGREAQLAANRQRDQFMTYPLCKGCEDARSWYEMKSIRERRNSLGTK